MTRNRNVLVIDDEVPICDFLKDFLEEKGYRVQVAPSFVPNFHVRTGVKAKSRF